MCYLQIPDFDVHKHVHHRQATKFRANNTEMILRYLFFINLFKIYCQASYTSLLYIKHTNKQIHDGLA